MIANLKGRAARFFAGVGVALALQACSRGLPSEPPGHDAADPEAAIPPYTPEQRSLDRSAFSEAALRGESDDSGGHMHHGHHGPGDASATPASPGGHEGHTMPTPAAPSPSGGHAGHAAPAKATTTTTGEARESESESEAKQHAS